MAYKAVNSDFKDKWSGEIDRQQCRPKSYNGALSELMTTVITAVAAGLHAGTLEYVQGYGGFYEDEEGNPLPSSDKCIIVKINPEDVVSVPDGL